MNEGYTQRKFRYGPARIVNLGTDEPSAWLYGVVTGFTQDELHLAARTFHWDAERLAELAADRKVFLASQSHPAPIVTKRLSWRGK